MNRVISSCIQAVEAVNRRRGGGMSIDGADSIRELRTNLGLSQRQFASRYGFDLYVLKSWEAGRRLPDKANTLILNLIAFDPEGMADRIGTCLAIGENQPVPEFN